MARELDPTIQRNVLLKSYVSVDDIYCLYPIGKHSARKLHRKVEDELTIKGVPIFDTRPKLVPLSEILKIFPIEEKRIKDAAERKIQVNEKENK